MTGTDTVVKTLSLPAAANRDYTAISAGCATGNKQPDFDVVLIEDDNAPPANNGVKRRVAHGAAGAPEVEVSVTGPFETWMGKEAILSRVPFEVASGYLTVQAASYQARVAVADPKAVAIDSHWLVAWNNMIRTIIAVDAKAGRLRRPDLFAGRVLR